MADISSTLQFLLQTSLDGVCSLHIFMTYMDKCTCKDRDIRGSHFIPFVKWAYDVNAKLDYSALTKYASYLESNGEQQKTISVKISHIRQFLKAAEDAGLIRDCVYYAKRGRKARKAIPLAVRHQPIQFRPGAFQSTQDSTKKRRGRPRKNPVNEETGNLKSQNRGFERTFLYDMFQINTIFTEDILKKSYRKLALYFHPDHEEGSQEKFLACKEAYDYLMDAVKRVKYDLYIQNPRGIGFKDVKDFVQSIYQRIGGYASLEL